MKNRSPFESSRFWAALSILLIGEFIALGLLRGELRPWLSAWRQVINNGLPGISITFSLLVIAVVLSRSLASGIWFLLESVGDSFQKTGFWLGRALALFPVHALACTLIGLWVGRWGFPIWSLMPVSADSSSLPFLERLSREVWTWSPAIFLLSLPLIGQWITLLSESAPSVDLPKQTAEDIEKSLATPHLDSPERIQGRPFEAFLLKTRNRIQLPDAMPRVMVKSHSHTLPNPVLGVGLLAFIFLFGIEDILGLPGSMGKLAQALRAHDNQAAATSVLMLSCVAALGTFCAGSPVFTVPPSIRCAFSWLFKGTAWCVVIVSLLAGTLAVPIPGLPSLNSELFFTHPLSAFWAGLPSMLCALSLWLLGHILRPLNAPLPHA